MLIFKKGVPMAENSKIYKRGKLDQTLAAMFSNMTYREDYLFYAHMIGLCSIKIDKNLQAPAGVCYMHDHYELIINPESVWVPFENIKPFIKPDMDDKIEKGNKDKNGIKEYRYIKGFDDFSLVQRLAILKHEMLHILYGHITFRFFKDINTEAWNYATDCALNQQINSDHLPKECILPKNLGEKFKIKIPENESSEFYYNLIKSKMNEKNKIDIHETWGKSKGDKDLQNDITKKMIEKAQNETIKSKGKIPGACSDWLEMFSRKSELNWKKVLRGIVGNKRIGTRSTIMRKDRRFPKRADLRGKTKERMFNLLVIGDVSGSMNNDAILQTFGEVRHICDLTKTDVDLVQVDAEAYEPEKLSKKTKLIERKGRGGTTLHPALEMAKKHKIDFQAVIVLTDGGLFGDDITYFSALNKKVIWLIEPDGYIMPEMNSGLMQAFKLKEPKK